MIPVFLSIIAMLTNILFSSCQQASQHSVPCRCHADLDCCLRGGGLTELFGTSLCMWRGNAKHSGCCLGDGGLTEESPSISKAEALYHSLCGGNATELSGIPSTCPVWEAGSASDETGRPTLDTVRSVRARGWYGFAQVCVVLPLVIELPVD